MKKAMKFSEIITKLQELKALYGDIEIEMLTDEGETVDIDIHMENIGNLLFLSFYN